MTRAARAFPFRHDFAQFGDLGQGCHGGLGDAHASGDHGQQVEGGLDADLLGVVVAPHLLQLVGFGKGAAVLVHHQPGIAQQGRQGVGAVDQSLAALCAGLEATAKS
jgi:hypothetical protein